MSTIQWQHVQVKVDNKKMPPLFVCIEINLRKAYESFTYMGLNLSTFQQLGPYVSKAYSYM